MSQLAAGTQETRYRGGKKKKSPWSLVENKGKENEEDRKWYGCTPEGPCLGEEEGGEMCGHVRQRGGWWKKWREGTRVKECALGPLS